MLSPKVPSNPRPSKILEVNGALGRPRLTKVPAVSRGPMEPTGGTSKEEPGREAPSQSDAPSAPISSLSSGSPHKQAGTLGSGRNRLLICVDDDIQDTSQQDQGGLDSLPLRTVSEDSILFGSPIAITTSSSSADVAAEPKKDLVLLGPVYKNGRKLSKMETKFDHLEKVMPQYKIDKPMRKTIVKTLKEMDCWSSDEEGGDQAPASSGKGSPPSPPKPKDSSPGRPSMKIKSMSTSHHSDSDQHEDNEEAFFSPTSIKPGQQAYRAAKVRDLARPNHIREKVPLQRPQQIADSHRLRDLHQAHAVEREEARAAVIDKAVEVLVDLRKQRLISEKNFLKTVSKDVSVGRRSQAHRFAFGLVSKALQKARRSTIERWTKYQQRQEQKRKRQNRAAMLIIRCWKAYRFRKLVHSVRSFGRTRKQADYQADQQDLYEYRFRVAQRRLQEQRDLLCYRQRTTSPSAPSPGGPASASAPASFSSSPRTTTDRERTTEETLFAQDDEHKRPDLAPFSTSFYEKIQRVARQHVPLVTTQDQLLQSIRLRHAERRPGSGAGTLRDPLRPSPLPSASSSSSAHLSVRPPSRAETWTSYQERQMWMSAEAMGSDRPSEGGYPEDGAPLWEEMATVNTSVAEARALLKEGVRSQVGVRRSAAYVALEKLCGLKEEDIQLHNHRYKSPRTRVNQSFLNSNLLR